MPVSDAGEVDDHGDVLVAAPGVSPHVLVHADRGDPVEPGGVVDQDALAFGQDRVVGGVPGDPEALGDAGHREVLAHDPFQRPPQTTTREPRARLRCPGGVLAPHMPAAAAPVAADRDQQRRGPPTQRLVRQPPGHRVTRRTFAAATSTPAVRLDDPARQDRTVRLKTLAHNLETKLIEVGERGQVRAREGSVRHVEVFQMSGVRTFILGRPRRLSPDRRADDRYTLICEEPSNVPAFSRPPAVSRYELCRSNPLRIPSVEGVVHL